MWGQPIPYGTDNSTGDVVVSALKWDIVGLAQRRPDFPSWSWVGCEGKAYPSVNSVYKEDITVSILLKDGTVIDDAEMLRNLDTFQSLSPSLSKYILIQAQTVHVKIRRKEGDHWNLQDL